MSSSVTSHKSIFLTVFTTLITAGLLGYVFDFITFSSGRDDSYISQVFQCKEDLALCQSRIVLLDNIRSQHPYPSWLTYLNGEFLAVSDSYESDVLFPLGLSKSDFLGTRGEIFGIEQADLYLAHSVQAAACNCPLTFPESLPPLGGGISHRYPIKNNKDQPILIGGFWVPTD